MSLARPLRSAAVALSTLAGAGAALAAPPDAESCPALEPGKAIGRYSLGTILKAPEAVAPAPLDGWFQPTDPAGQDTRLRFDAQKKLVAFDTPLPRCVTVPGTPPRALRDATPRQLAAALGTCGPEKVLEGGTWIECGGVAIVTTLGAKGIEHRLRMQSDAPSKAPAVACDVYFDGDATTDADGAKPATEKPARLEVGTRRVCLAGWPAALGANTRAADVTAGRTCKTEMLRGGTHVTCGEVTFGFAGPAEALHTITLAR